MPLLQSCLFHPRNNSCWSMPLQSSSWIAEHMGMYDFFVVTQVVAYQVPCCVFWFFWLSFPGFLFTPLRFFPFFWPPYPECWVERWLTSFGAWQVCGLTPTQVAASDWIALSLTSSSMVKRANNIPVVSLRGVTVADKCDTCGWCWHYSQVSHLPSPEMWLPGGWIGAGFGPSTHPEGESDKQEQEVLVRTDVWVGGRKEM
jgi:hypothetical protein